MVVSCDGVLGHEAKILYVVLQNLAGWTPRQEIRKVLLFRKFKLHKVQDEYVLQLYVASHTFIHPSEDEASSITHHAIPL